jgi:hypothetical protein
VNTDQLRHALREKWLTYYDTHRVWITRMGIWVESEGHRRPSSSFILGVLSVLEPQLTQMFPFIVELSPNPDLIVAALGLNFNPDQQLEAMVQKRSLASKSQAGRSSPSEPAARGDDPEGLVKLLPAASSREVSAATERVAVRDVRQVRERDEECSGRERGDRARRL